MGCRLRTLQRSGKLCLRLHWRMPDGRVFRTQEATGLSDTPNNRRILEREIVAPVRALMRARKFDRAAYLQYFPTGARAAEFRVDLAIPLGEAAPPVNPVSVADYYRVWIARKTPPHVRPSGLRDYRQHFTRYILPALGDEALHELSLRHLIELRDQLTGEGLAPKTIRNIIGSSLRAMLREAKGEGVSAAYAVFDDLDLAPGAGFQPDPFTVAERDWVIAYFADLAGGRWHPFVLTLALTGMRPSEATGLHCGDVDVVRGQVTIQRSRTRGGEYPMPKTQKSRRTIPVRPELIAAWRPLLEGAAPGRALFLHAKGGPLQQENWRSDYWKPCLEAGDIRHRDLYALRDTFISLALSEGAPTIAVANYCGTSIAMIEQSYGRFIPQDTRGLTAFVRAPGAVASGSVFAPRNRAKRGN